MQVCAVVCRSEGSLSGNSRDSLLLSATCPRASRRRSSSAASAEADVLPSVLLFEVFVDGGVVFHPVGGRQVVVSIFKQ